MVAGGGVWVGEDGDGDGCKRCEEVVLDELLLT